MKTVILVQQFDVRPTPGERTATNLRVHPCLEAQGVTWKRSYVSEDGRRQWCEFDAPDAEAVRQACRSAGLPIVGAYAVTKEES